MAYLSNIPQLQFAAAGLVVPAEIDVLAGVQADIDAAFGGGLNPALETPQGQLASSHSASIGDKNNEIAYLVNQIDPQYADGRFQDAIGRIYFLTRKPATATAVMATLIGLNGTIVPAGTLAQDTSGNIYKSTGAATIGISGSVITEFQNTATGPIACPAGTLIKVYQAIPGWNTITNANDGVMGTYVETRQDFEKRRAASVTINAKGTVAAIYANVAAVPNVLDVYVIENNTGAAVSKGSTNYSVIKNSVYVAVVGGVDADIAAAIWLKKDLGCDYNGSTSVAVIDDSYSYPQPSYTVKFQRPSALPIKFAVQIVNDPALPSNIVTLIKNAIIAKFNGTDGTNRERIGGVIFASRYYGPVSQSASNVSLISILIGTSTATLAQVAVGIDQYPTITASNITVTLI